MIKVNVEHAITKFVDYMLDSMTCRETADPEIENGVLVQVEVKVKEDPEKWRVGIQQASRIVHLLFIRPSVSTWVLAFESEGLVVPDYYSNFEHQSYHDSCWRTDGLEKLSSVRFDLQRLFAEDKKLRYDARIWHISDVTVRSNRKSDDRREWGVTSTRGE